MDVSIYFRGSLAEETERSAATKYFRVIEQRTHARSGELVIPRYSALPFNRELCADLQALGATPINSFRQHSYAADLRSWYQDLEGITPTTWFALDQIPRDGRAFVLKGETNSKKFEWSSLMYAKDARTAIDVYGRLSQDSLIGHQHICIREYVPLKKLADGLNGLQVSNEFRFFVLDGKVLASGFYWSSHLDDLSTVPNVSEVPREFISEVARRIGDNIRFYVVDIAQTEKGDWLVVEVNDGCQSGLSEVDPESLYGELYSKLA